MNTNPSPPERKPISALTVSMVAHGKVTATKPVTILDIIARIKSGEWTVNDISLVEKQLEKLVYQFGIRFYRDKIQAQIDEGQQALEAVVRQQQRLTNQNKDLNIRLGNNGQEKIQLEKAIEANKLENLVLLQKIENNKKSQDSVAQAGEKIKKVIELHKDRQRKVN